MESYTSFLWHQNMLQIHYNFFLSCSLSTLFNHDLYNSFLTTGENWPVNFLVSHVSYAYAQNSDKHDTISLPCLIKSFISHTSATTGKAHKQLAIVAQDHPTTQQSGTIGKLDFHFIFIFCCADQYSSWFQQVFTTSLHHLLTHGKFVVVKKKILLSHILISERKKWNKLKLDSFTL